MTVKTTSVVQTQKFGAEFAEKIKNGGVVCLSGDLGAGKTTLVQGIARGLGIRRRLISPTFILARRYEIKNQKSLRPRSGRAKIKMTNQNLKMRHLWHIDLYRLENLDEARAIGIEELMDDQDNILLIEWPEKIEPLLPKNHISIKLEIIGENKRRISYEALH